MFAKIGFDKDESGPSKVRGIRDVCCTSAQMFHIEGRQKSAARAERVLAAGENRRGVQDGGPVLLPAVQRRGFEQRGQRLAVPFGELELAVPSSQQS